VASAHANATRTAQQLAISTTIAQSNATVTALKGEVNNSIAAENPSFGDFIVQVQIFFVSGDQNSLVGLILRDLYDFEIGPNGSYAQIAATVPKRD